MIYIQATDNKFYRDPKIGTKDYVIYVPDLEDKPKIAIRKGVHKDKVKGMIDYFAKIKKTGGNHGSMVFPPDWLVFKDCRIYDCEIVSPVPVDLLSGEVAVSDLFVRDYSYDSIIFSLTYQPEEIKAIYEGKLKSPLFKGLKIRTIRDKIKKQTGDLVKGVFDGKPVLLKR